MARLSLMIILAGSMALGQGRDRPFKTCPARAGRGTTVLRTSIIGLALMMALLAGMPGSAGAIAIISGDGTESCATNASFATANCDQDDNTGNQVDNIMPHTAWQNPDLLAGDAVWISYKNSGIGGGASLAPITPHIVPAPVNYLMKITEEFMTSIDGALLNLTTWADDTARILIDGVPQNVPNFTQATCAEGPLGCRAARVLLPDQLQPRGGRPAQNRVGSVSGGPEPERPGESVRPSLFRQLRRLHDAGPGAGDAPPGGDGRDRGRRGRLETTPGGDHCLTGNRPEFPAGAPFGAPPLFSLAPRSRLKVSSPLSTPPVGSDGSRSPGRRRPSGLPESSAPGPANPSTCGRSSALEPSSPPSCRRTSRRTP